MDKSNQKNIFRMDFARYLKRYAYEFCTVLLLIFHNKKNQKSMILSMIVVFDYFLISSNRKYFLFFFIQTAFCSSDHQTHTIQHY